VLVALTLPVTLLSLGLFIFVINGLLFWLVAQPVDGFHVGGFWSAVPGGAPVQRDFVGTLHLHPETPDGNP
jgi:uncharacterized membrane protein YvlD (DUF360 family)